MPKIDIVMGKNTRMVGVFDRRSGQNAQDLPTESQMDDFITYKNLSRYCMDYLGPRVWACNDKNEAIKRQVTGVMPKASLSNVEDRLTASYTFGQQVAVRLHALVSHGLLSLVYP